MTEKGGGAHLLPSPEPVPPVSPYLDTGASFAGASLGSPGSS
jgi:hypothetical protein